VRRKHPRVCVPAIRSRDATRGCPAGVSGCTLERVAASGA
jgi:hypothetical protein